MTAGASGIVFVYSTFPDIESARVAARALVERRLVACVNMIPGMISAYRWEGRVEEGEEIVFLAKTLASNADAVMAAIGELHPFDVPALVVLAVASASEAFGAWVNNEVSRAD